jgi:uncharacterized membrane protein (DUF485 family)
MPSLDAPPPPVAPRDPRTEAYNARLGLWLFAAYLAAYAAYVLVNAFVPALMATEALAGLNVAVASGLGLILLAAVVAFVYASLARGATP